ncbi:MAG: HEAT repeat domain-containing protein [Pseudomonadota bacterium]
MAMDLRGKRAVFQVALLVSFSALAVEEAPLRFGDPETMIDAGTPTAVPSTAEPERTEKPAPAVDLAGKIRAILATVPSGSDYPEQLSEIVDLGTPAVPPLVSLFQDASASWQARWIVGIALGRLGTKTAREALEKGMTDSLFLIRMAAIQALTSRGDSSVAALLRPALSDRAMVVRCKAVDSLEALKDGDSIPDLVKELGAPRNFYRGRSLWIRGRIVDALGSIGDKKAVSALLAVLRESELEIRLRACGALTKLSPDAALAGPDAQSEKCVEHWSKWGEAHPLH